VRDLLALPARLRTVAWLCVGPVSHLAAEPDLERHGWGRRRPLADAVHRNSWQGTDEWAAVPSLDGT
jgi:5,6-dimethylbenzimidazole synthase